MNPSTDAARTELLVTTMSERMAHMTRTLATWMHHQPHTLAEVEQHVLRLVKQLGAALVTGLASLAAPLQPAAELPCPCGHVARYQRQRPAKVTTILGPITVERPYYLCRTCKHGYHPLDTQLQLCAGSRSAALDELLALLGATQDSFAEAASVLDRLTLVHVSPNSVRDVTEELGQTLLAHQQQAVADAMDGTEPPDVTPPVPERLYITMDGVLAHLHERGWSELKVGCCYQTHSRVERKRPEHLDIRAHSLSSISSLKEAQDFGYQLWQEAARRGVREAKEVVVLGDGAHWIWNIADTQVSGATQIVDWYHASSYVWKAASAIWGEVHPQREAWAHRHLEMLWEGKVEQVVEELEQQQGSGDGVRAAVIYFLEHGKRMDYPMYRARGLQIGSGSVESACKQLVSARLKQAGMIWDAAGAEAVAMVRAWLKSERWQEAMALRAVPRRSYERQQARPGAEESSLAEAGPRGRLEPDVLARVRAEMAQEGSPHPWRKAWSVRRQREQSLEQMQTATTTLAA